MRMTGPLDFLVSIMVSLCPVSICICYQSHVIPSQCIRYCVIWLITCLPSSWYSSHLCSVYCNYWRVPAIEFHHELVCRRRIWLCLPWICLVWLMCLPCVSRSLRVNVALPKCFIYIILLSPGSVARFWQFQWEKCGLMNVILPAGMTITSLSNFSDLYKSDGGLFRWMRSNRLSVYCESSHSVLRFFYLFCLLLRQCWPLCPITVTVIQSTVQYRFFTRLKTVVSGLVICPFIRHLCIAGRIRYILTRMSL